MNLFGFVGFESNDSFCVCYSLKSSANQAYQAIFQLNLLWNNLFFICIPKYIFFNVFFIYLKIPEISKVNFISTQLN